MHELELPLHVIVYAAEQSFRFRVTFGAESHDHSPVASCCIVCDCAHCFQPNTATVNSVIAQECPINTSAL